MVFDLEAADGGLVTFEDAETFAGAEVPDFAGVVDGGGDHGAERDVEVEGRDGVRVGLDFFDVVTGFEVLVKDRDGLSPRALAFPGRFLLGEFAVDGFGHEFVSRGGAVRACAVFGAMDRLVVADVRQLQFLLQILDLVLDADNYAGQQGSGSCAPGEFTFVLHPRLLLLQRRQSFKHNIPHLVEIRNLLINLPDLRRRHIFPDSKHFQSPVKCSLFPGHLRERRRTIVFRTRLF